MEYVIRREGNEDYLEHYGTKGQKWGVRRFENPDGTLTEEGKIRYAKAQKDASKYESKSSRFKKIGRAARTGAEVGAGAGLGALLQIGYASNSGGPFNKAGLGSIGNYMVRQLRDPKLFGVNAAGIASFALAGALGGAAVSGIKQGVQAAKVKRGQKFIEDYRSAYEKTYGVQG